MRTLSHYRKRDFHVMQLQNHPNWTSIRFHIVFWDPSSAADSTPRSIYLGDLHRCTIWFYFVPLLFTIYAWWFILVYVFVLGKFRVEDIVKCPCEWDFLCDYQCSRKTCSSSSAYQKEFCSTKFSSPIIWRCSCSTPFSRTLRGMLEMRLFICFLW